MMEGYKDTSTNTKGGGSYYNNHHNNNHKNKRNNRSNNKNFNANNGNNNAGNNEYQNTGNNQRGGNNNNNNNKFANKTNTFLNNNNNKNNNQTGGGKQRRGSSNNYNSGGGAGQPAGGIGTLNTSKSCNNGFIRHESFDDRLSKSFSKDKQSPNNSFVDYQLPTSYSFDNLNKQVRTPNKQSQPTTTNAYSFLSSNIDPYAKLSPARDQSNKENDHPVDSQLSVSNNETSKSNTPRQQELNVNDETISCYSTPLSQVDNNTVNNITLNSSGNTTLSSDETNKTGSQQYLSPPEHKFNINDISEDSTTMSANHQDILNLINKDILSPDDSSSRSVNDDLVTASEGEGSFGQEATMNVEKTIISTSFDKAALDNLISNLDQQNQSGQVDLNDLDIKVAEASINDNQSEIENEEAEEKPSQEITDLVNKIVQEVVVKAKEIAEKEEEETVESFELIEKQELTEEDLKQIELEEKRSIELKEVKLSDNESGVAVTATPDKINKSVTFSPTRTEISQSVAFNGSETIDQIKSSPKTSNGINESTLSMNSAGGKQGKQKAAASDVDCFSCSIL